LALPEEVLRAIALQLLGAHTKISAGAFWRETKSMLVEEWKICIYCIILMTWFNFYR